MNKSIYVYMLKGQDLLLILCYWYLFLYTMIENSVQNEWMYLPSPEILDLQQDIKQEESVSLIGFSETHPLQNCLASVVDKNCWVILVDYRHFWVVKTFRVPKIAAFLVQARPRHHLPSVFHFDTSVYGEKKKNNKKIRLWISHC